MVTEKIPNHGEKEDVTYELSELPYPYDTSEPYVDGETTHLHHNKHHNTYVAILKPANKTAK